MHLIRLRDGARRERNAVDLGELVCHRGSELGVGGGETDAYEAALLGRIDVEAVEIGAQHALLLGLGAVAKIECVHDAADQRRRLQRAVELRLFGEPFRVNHLDREIGRHERPHVRIDRLLVHARGNGFRGGCIARLRIPFGRHELDLRLGAVFGRHEGENDVGGYAGGEA